MARLEPVLAFALPALGAMVQLCALCGVPPHWLLDEWQLAHKLIGPARTGFQQASTICAPDVPASTEARAELRHLNVGTNKRRVATLLETSVRAVPTRPNSIAADLNSLREWSALNASISLSA
jgi:hypothetical protein